MHDADDGHAVLDEPDRHADRVEAVQEVRGAVERVDEPAERRRASPPASSPNTGMPGVASASTSRTARSLARSAALTQSPGAFSRTLARRAELLGDDLAAARAPRRRDREQRGRDRQCSRVNVSSPASARQLRRLASSSGVPAPSSWRRADERRGHELLAVASIDRRAGFDGTPGDRRDSPTARATDPPSM